jgi:hypothetical protein
MLDEIQEREVLLSGLPKIEVSEISRDDIIGGRWQFAVTWLLLVVGCALLSVFCVVLLSGLQLVHLSDDVLKWYIGAMTGSSTLLGTMANIILDVFKRWPSFRPNS